MNRKGFGTGVSNVLEGKAKKVISCLFADRTHAQVTLSGICNHLTYCLIHVVHKKFTNIAAGRWVDNPPPPIYKQAVVA